MCGLPTRDGQCLGQMQCEQFPAAAAALERQQVASPHTSARHVAPASVSDSWMVSASSHGVPGDCLVPELTRRDWNRLLRHYLPYVTKSCRQMDYSKWLIHAMTALVHLTSCAFAQTGSLLTASAARMVVPFLLVNALHGGLLFSPVYQRHRNAVIIMLEVLNMLIVVTSMPLWVNGQVSNRMQMARTIAVTSGSVATCWQAVIHQTPWPLNAAMLLAWVTTCAAVLHPMVCSTISTWPEGPRLMAALHQQLDWAASQVLPLRPHQGDHCASVVNMYHVAVTLLLLTIMWVNNQRKWAAFLSGCPTSWPKPAARWPLMPPLVAACMLLLVAALTLAAAWELVQVPGGPLATAGRGLVGVWSRVWQ